MLAGTVGDLHLARALAGGPLGVEPHFPAEKIIGVDIAEQHRRIGEGRLRSAAAIADRAGLGAGRQRLRAGIHHPPLSALRNGAFFSKPSRATGSSMLPVNSDSKTRLPRPGGAVPFKVNGLYLSKLDARVGATSRISPPLGALGFTCAK